MPSRVTVWENLLANNLEAFSELLALFDRNTQRKFYRNFTQAMQTQDYMLPGITFNPELLALVEKSNAKKV